MINGLIVATCLLPTEGHIDLIRFASNFIKYRGGTLHVMICSRSFEPISGDDRKFWIYNRLLSETNLSGNDIVIHHLCDDNVPQNPNEHPHFWDIWKQKISNTTKIEKFQYVFASERYGTHLADILGGQFIPYDIAREIRPISSTMVRRDPQFYWDQIIDPARQHINRKFGQFVLFGQESVGKTTIAKTVARHLRCTFSPEWARPYLETVGEDLTEQKINNIFDAQWAQQVNIVGNTPYSILDTDILSTIGYMRLKYGNIPESWIKDSEIDDMISTHYFVLPDNIPFVQDKLRYGGNTRETTMQYWIDILEEFNCSYSIVPQELTSISDKSDWIKQQITMIFHQKTSEIRLFNRT